MNAATALATVLVDELLRCGMREAVVAPGSRSTPLALALFAAEQAERLRLHVRVDERSAGFLALGLAKASGTPVAVVCTSGSAAANLHPAVVEADHAGVGLIVLTADRPPELRGTGASQTIDQLRMFGGAVRGFVEVGVPERVPGMVGYWRSLTCRSYLLATGVEAGPVHLNVALREPLVPGPGSAWPEPLDGRPGGAPWVATDSAVGHPMTGLPTAGRGVLVVGDPVGTAAESAAVVDALRWHAEQLGWPVLAEPTSGARRGPHAVVAYHQLLGIEEFVADHVPDVVVSTGRPTLSRPVQTFLAAAAEHVVVSPSTTWPDPTRSATRLLRPQAPLVPASGGCPLGSWVASWLQSDAVACATRDTLLDGRADLGEQRLARDLGTGLPDGALLWVASSMPVRDLDQTMPARAGLRVLTNRGASGIDGLVSSAVGAALAHQRTGGGAAVALLGDLAFLHDTNGLLIGPEEPVPDLAVVVVANDGGGIFSMLPQAGHADAFERLFGTPHGTDIAALAAAHGVPHRRVTRPADLPDALSGTGLRLVEVPTSRATEHAARTEVRTAIAAALAAERHPVGA